MATFGYTSIGSNISNITNQIKGSKATLTESGSVTSITAYLYDNFGSTVLKAKAAIYDVSGNLIAETGEKSLTVSVFNQGWYQFDFSSPVDLTADDYLLVVWHHGSGARNVKYDTGSSGDGVSQSITYGSFPDPASFTATSEHASIYATYTPSGGSITVSSSVAGIAATIGAVAVITSQILSPSPLTANFSTPIPSVSVANANYKPLGLLLAITQQSGGRIINPNPATAEFSVQTSSVATDQILSVGEQSLSFSIPSPTATIPTGFSADVQSLAFSSQSPAIVISQVVTPAVQTASFSISAAQVNHNAFVTSDTQTATFSVPTVSVAQSIVVSPESLALSGSIPEVSPITDNILSTGIQSSAFSLPAPAVTIDYANASAVQTLIVSIPPISLVTENYLDISVQALSFSIPTLIRSGGFYTDKYQHRNTSYGDKYTARNTPYGNKYSVRNTDYDDKYTKLNL